MDVDCTPTHTAGLARMAEPTPIVFVVDDDISVRESLELLIRYEGWQTETFSSAQEFMAVQGPSSQTAWSSMYLFRGSADLTCRNVLVTIGAKCRASSARAMATYP